MSLRVHGCLWPILGGRHLTNAIRRPLPAHSRSKNMPLAYLLEHLCDAELRRFTIQKKANAILATMKRAHWLLKKNCGFDLFTGHVNLVFLLSPMAFIADLSQTTLLEVLYRVVRLNAYTYTCIHIPGSDNVWTDMITRFLPPFLVQRIVSIPVLPSFASDGILWPCPDKILKLQAEHTAFLFVGLSVAEDGLYKTDSGTLWMPDEADDLHLRLLFIAHTGTSGHRSADTSKNVLVEHFTWSELSADIHTFRIFLPSLSNHCWGRGGGGEEVPRP